MKIGQQGLSRTSGPSSRNGRWFSALAIIFVAGIVIGILDWSDVLHDLSSVGARIARSVNPPDASDVPTLVVDMSFTSYDEILSQRDSSLLTGVYVPSDGDFMPATISVNGDDRGDAIPVRMRLLAGPADNLGENEKWGFEVETRRNSQLLEMRKFTLVDPAVNNWISQWAFARSLEREGILAARYRFVHLILNGDDRGIYAVQEGAAGELLAAQGRAAGAIIGFDAELLWESIAHFEGDASAAYADPVANLSATDLQYLEVEAFRSTADSPDADLRVQESRAISLLRGLQAGELKASAMFDVERYGRFLALVDLWGATQATSLANLTYYLNPTSGQLEPIGAGGNPLGTDLRLSLAATYVDPVLQATYAREAARVSQPEYLDDLQAELEPEFRQLQAALGRQEFAPPWDALRDRQNQIRRSLDPVQPVFAYLGSPTLAMSATLRVYVGNVLNLPVEVVGFDIGGATYLPADGRWLADESAGLVADQAEGVVLLALDAAHAPVVRYAQFDLSLIEIHRLDNELEFMQEVEIRVATRILGLSTDRYTVARQGHPDVLPLEATE